MAYNIILWGTTIEEYCRETDGGDVEWEVEKVANLIPCNSQVDVHVRAPRFVPSLSVLNAVALLVTRPHDGREFAVVRDLLTFSVAHVAALHPGEPAIAAAMNTGALNLGVRGVRQALSETVKKAMAWKNRQLLQQCFRLAGFIPGRNKFLKELLDCVLKGSDEVAGFMMLEILEGCGVSKLGLVLECLKSVEGVRFTFQGSFGREEERRFTPSLVAAFVDLVLQRDQDRALQMMPMMQWLVRAQIDERIYNPRSLYWELCRIGNKHGLRKLVEDALACLAPLLRDEPSQRPAVSRSQPSTARGATSTATRAFSVAKINVSTQKRGGGAMNTSSFNAFQEQVLMDDSKASSTGDEQQNSEMHHPDHRRGQDEDIPSTPISDISEILTTGDDDEDGASVDSDDVEEQQDSLDLTSSVLPSSHTVEVQATNSPQRRRQQQQCGAKRKNGSPHPSRLPLRSSTQPRRGPPHQQPQQPIWPDWAAQ